MRIAFPALLRRFPNLTVGLSTEDVRFRGHHAVYGLESLPVTW
jgi:cytochrome P450